jgi:hypothetical protein
MARVGHTQIFSLEGAGNLLRLCKARHWHSQYLQLLLQRSPLPTNLFALRVLRFTFHIAYTVRNGIGSYPCLAMQFVRLGLRNGRREEIGQGRMGQKLQTQY